MPTSAPWMQSDFFPPAPSIGVAGVFDHGQPVPCQFETSLSGKVMNGADLVWSSASDRVVVPAELPELRHALLLRMRHRLKSQIGLPVVNSAIWLSLALYLAMNRDLDGLARWQQYLFIGVALGLFPLGSTLWELWRHRSLESVDWAARIQHDRFVAWMAQRRGKTAYFIASGLLLVFMVQFATDVAANAAAGRSFLAAGARRDLVLGGEPWRLLTAGLLHGGVMHLIFNATALLALARQVEAIGGRWRLLAVFAASIVGGFVASIAWQAEKVAVGASGGLFGLMGWLLVIAWRGRATFPSRWWRSIAFLVALNGALGWMARAFIDNAAHGGGLAIGIVAALLTRLDDARMPAGSTSSVRTAGWLAALALVGAAAWATYVLLRP